LNIGLLAVFYTVLGGLLSYVIYYLFEDHGDDWEKRSFAYKLTDVLVELTIVGVTAFWITLGIKDYPPLVPMSREMDSLVDTYISAVFFGYSMFMFLDDLTKKIKSLFATIFQKNFDKIFSEGSVLDLVFSRKTD
jgi:uncharacterized membrane-anchored protein